MSIAYTPENEATQFGTLLTADYGADGLRAWKQDALGTRTYFLYDGVTPIHELDGTGAIKATNTFGANGLTSRRDALGNDAFYTFDERGNVSERTNSTGQVLTRHIADAYGNISSYDASGTPLAQLPDPYSGFGGKHGYYTDGETGLILCTYRYYDPNTGRWLNSDPIGYEGGINLYAYCSGNPVMIVDPSGLDPLTKYQLDAINDSLALLRKAGYTNTANEIAKMLKANKIQFDPNPRKESGTNATVVAYVKGSDKSTIYLGPDAVSKHYCGIKEMAQSPGNIGGQSAVFKEKVDISATLVHELVHVHQTFSYKMTHSQATLEKHAYTAELRYLNRLLQVYPDKVRSSAIKLTIDDTTAASSVTFCL